MNDNFLTSQVIPNLPEWFVPIFQHNDRLCLPYVISIRDAGDIIRATFSSAIIFHIEARGFTPAERPLGSVVDFVNDIHDFIFQNVPAEAVISFGNRQSWMYYDGDERFSCLIASSNIIKEAFRNDRDTMRLYYIDQSDDITLNNEIKFQLFESITTVP